MSVVGMTLRLWARGIIEHQPSVAELYLALRLDPRP